MNLEKDLAKIAGETETGAVHRAAEERREQVPPRDRQTEVLRYLEREIWPKVPSGLLGRGLTEEEQEGILGYGPEGV